MEQSCLRCASCVLYSSDTPEPYQPLTNLYCKRRSRARTGSLRIVVTPEVSRHHGVCSFESHSGFASGLIDVAATEEEQQKAIATKQAIGI